MGIRFIEGEINMDGSSFHLPNIRPNPPGMAPGSPVRGLKGRRKAQRGLAKQKISAQPEWHLPVLGVRPGLEASAADRELKARGGGSSESSVPELPRLLGGVIEATPSPEPPPADRAFSRLEQARLGVLRQSPSHRVRTPVVLVGPETGTADREAHETTTRAEVVPERPRLAVETGPPVLAAEPAVTVSRTQAELQTALGRIDWGHIGDFSHTPSLNITRSTRFHSNLGFEFKPEKKLGQGSFGTAYKVSGPDGKFYVVKTMNSLDAEMLGNMRTEISSMCRVKGLPHQAQIVDWILPTVDQPVAGIVMEYIEGQDLDKYYTPGIELADNPAFKADVRELLIACDELRSVGLVHCDLKPANLRRGIAAGLSMLDYGCGLDEGTVLGPMKMVGTPYFLSPEMCTRKPITSKTDLYSVGVMIYKMITKALPYEFSDFFHGSSLVEPDQQITNVMGIIYKVALQFPKKYPELIETMRANGLEGSWQGLVLALMNPDPAARPSLGDLLDHPWLREIPRATGERAAEL